LKLAFTTDEAEDRLVDGKARAGKQLRLSRRIDV